MQRKRWQDLSPSQQRLIGIFGVIQIGMLVAALWDLARRPAEQIKGKKWVWAAISLINFVGPLTYFIFGRRRPSLSEAVHNEL